MAAAEQVERIGVNKSFGITIYRRMTGDDFPGKKTEACARLQAYPAELES